MCLNENANLKSRIKFCSCAVIRTEMTAVELPVAGEDDLATAHTPHAGKITANNAQCHVANPPKSVDDEPLVANPPGCNWCESARMLAD